MRLSRRLIALLLGSLLTACSSKMPQSAADPGASQLPTVTPDRPDMPSASPTAAQGAITPAPSPTIVSEGPVTPSMTRLRISGQKFAALGDPSAPITIVEFSDYG